MWPLPVSELFMIGKKTVPKLFNLGIKTIGDLANYNPEILVKKFGKFGITMHEFANGIDSSEVNNKHEDPKSISNEVTLPKDVKDIEELNTVLVALAEQVSYRLRKHGLNASTVAVSLKTNKFETYSHQTKLPYETSSTKEIISSSKKVLKDMYKGEPIRLIGLRVDKLDNSDEKQLSFFEETKRSSKQESIDKVMDSLKQNMDIIKSLEQGN